MRIKIIGDNNCARATRHLLRKAGFAVSEFLPAEVITQAPHSGYAITIDLAPATLPHPAIVPNFGTVAGLPSSKPDYPTHGQTATNDGEASTIAPMTADASSPAFVPNAGTSAGRPSYVSNAGSAAGRPSFSDNESLISPGARHAVPLHNVADMRAGSHSASIHFDSVDSELEAAILRHVTQLAAAPVVVDRPGGVVHSERELRIIIPRAENVQGEPLHGMNAHGEPLHAKTGPGESFMDEAAAIAVEFGVLRGLLDLISPQVSPLTAGTPATGAESAGDTGKKRWWMIFGRAQRKDHTLGILILLTATLVAFTAKLHASPRHVPVEFTHVIEGRGVDGAYLHLEAALAPAQVQFGTGQMNLALIGGSAVSSSLYDSGNTALKVNCVVGCGATSSFGDNAAFTAGTTAVNNISAVFNDSITALISGNAGALRSTTDRMLYVNIGKLGGTALSGANVVDSGNTAFRVNCVVGCSASAGFTDNSAFTAGTTTESNVGGVFNDGLSALSSGNAAAARITSSRAIHVNLRNASGTEIGTASNPVHVDPTGTTTQPVTIQSNAAVNVAQVNGVTVTTGNGASGTGVQRVSIASDNSAVAGLGAGATGSAVPGNAVYHAGNGSGNLKGYLNCDGYAFDRSTTSDVQLVAISGSTTVYVCGYVVSGESSTASDVNLRWATASNCTTGATNLTPPITVQAAASTGPIGLSVMTPGFVGLNTGASHNLCVHRSAVQQSEIQVWYTQF